MYSRILRSIRGFYIIFIISILIIILFCAGMIYNEKMLSNLTPETLSYSKLEKEEHTVIKLKSYSIIGPFKNFYKENKDDSSRQLKIKSIGYIGYDNETDKYFGFLVPEKYTDIFEEYLAEKENNLNIPKLLGTVREMNEEEKLFFKDALITNMYNNLLNEYINKNQIDFENIPEEESNIIKKELKKIAKNPEILQSKTDFYIIDYKNFKDIFLYGVTFLSVIIVCFFILIYKHLEYKRYSKLEKFKNQIISNPNFTENDVDEDLKNAKVYMYNIFVGDKFIILLTEKNVELVFNENLAWAFIFKTIRRIRTGSLSKRRRKIRIDYHLFTADFDGNNCITNFSYGIGETEKVLHHIKENCPNALVGYSNKLLETPNKDTLLNLSTEYINNLKNLDDTDVDINYFPYFNYYGRSTKSNSFLTIILVIILILIIIYFK